MTFPTITGSNLLRQAVRLPDGLKGRLNLLLIPFLQWQQMQVDSWIPTARNLERDFPGFCAYELPTIKSMNPVSRFFINEGMRAGIPNPLTRQRTITLYLDKQSFRQQLDIGTEAEITVLLIDQQGKIYWRSAGEYTAEKGADLVQALGEIMARVL